MENNQQLLENLSLEEDDLEFEIVKACYNDNTEKVWIVIVPLSRLLQMEM